MRFMVIIKSDKNSEAGLPTNPELMDAIGKHAAELTEAGIMLAVGGLLPSSQGARLRVAGGAMSVTDGPFAEAKEMIGGFAILKADSKDHAIRLAKEFLQIHVDVLGPSYEGNAEIRQMFDPADHGPEGMCSGDDS